MASVSPFTELEQAEALTCYALANGNMKRTEELMQSRKLPKRLSANAKLVSQWANNSKRELYAKIRAKVEEAINTQLADAHLEMAAEAISLERKIMQEWHAKIDSGELEPKEMSNVHRTLSISGGIHTQRAIELTGKSQDITVKHDFSDLQHIISKATEGRVAIKAGTAAPIDVKAIEEKAAA